MGAWWVAVPAGMLALFATYWDDAWHTDVGRDSAWIPPHLLLYGAITVVGIVVAGWGFRTLWLTRSVRSALGYRPVTVASLGGAGALAAAPIDATWHAQFGRDAVLWSPPHMLLVFASTALIIGILTGSPHHHRPLRWAASVLLIGNAAAVVFEYETGVPQFSEAFYLPILILTGMLVAWVARESVSIRFPVAAMVLGYAGLRIAISLTLLLLGRSTPDLPLAVLGLALIDLPLPHLAQRYAAGACATAAIAWLAAATGLASQAPGAIAISAAPIIAVAAIVVVAAGYRDRWAPTVAGGLLAAAVLPLSVPPPPARAHDPGQGAPVQRVQLTGASNVARTLTIRATVAHGCNTLAPADVVARRAGDTIVAPLHAVRSCTYTGTIEVPTNGRWFVYVELRQSTHRQLEAWIPLNAGHAEQITQTRELYVPAEATARTRPAEMIAGTVIYAIGIALLIAAVRTALGVNVARVAVGRR
ncbi:hypothetical protein [Skermania sp. ID1734]|uniref:hypothetical protein n=1 Tax=Skermania sp. ID1734 TaxID=2597516 RepID=UPI00163D7E28|nr:hypothetical protein [Skermania sp. ID1734]